MQPDHIRAHGHSSRHLEEIGRSEVCGCFYCLRTFPPVTILQMTDGGQTALCPHCGVDSVIGSASGFPITGEFLEEMKEVWFSSRARRLGP